MSKKNLSKQSSHPSSDPNEGLPDIAKDPQATATRYLGILVVALLALLALVGIWKANKKPSRQPLTPALTEETYTVQGATPSEQVPSSVQPPTALTEQQTPIAPQLTEEQQQLLEALEKERVARLQAPVMVINTSQRASQGTSRSEPSISNDPNTQFLQEVSTKEGDTLAATLMGNRSLILAEGTLIHGILETAISSDLPGMLRAIVAEPVYSEDGSQVLIAPGSRLIGEYKSSMQQGQARIFVAWTTLIQPTGSRIKLASPGVDNLGVAGMGADDIDRHFIERFGSTALLSLLGAGAANVGVSSNDPYNAKQAYRQAVAQSFVESARETYKQTGSIPPTLHIEQGKPIMVFVAHTLDFAGVTQTAQHHKLNLL